MEDLRASWQRMKTRFDAYAKAREEFGLALLKCLQKVVPELELMPHWEETWIEPLFFRRMPESPYESAVFPLREIVNRFFGSYILESGNAYVTTEERDKLEDIFRKLGFKEKK